MNLTGKSVKAACRKADGSAHSYAFALAEQYQGCGTGELGKCKINPVFAEESALGIPRMNLDAAYLIKKQCSIMICTY